MTTPHKPTGRARFGSMTARMILLNVGVVVVTAVTVSTVLHHLNCQQRIKEQGVDLEHIATAGAMMISAEDHAKIRSRTDTDSESFTRIKSQLARIQGIYELPHDALYTLREVKTRHGMETEFITMLGTPYTGDRYSMRPKMEEAIRTGRPTHTDEVYKDQYGSWLSGYAPIILPDGTVDGILEVDYRADKVMALASGTRNQTILYTILCSLIAGLLSVLMMRWMLRPLGSLVDATHALQQGNYDHRIDTASTASELEILADTFNSMIETLQQRDKILSASEKRYRTLFDEVQEALFVVQRDNGRVLDTNGAGAQLLCQKREDVLGQSFVSLWQSDEPTAARVTDIATMHDLLREDPHPSRGRTCSLTSATPHGVRFFELKASAADVDGQAAWLITCQDTTQLREHWATLLQASKLTAIGEMAGGLAHQINNPLIGVLNFAQLLRRQLPDDDPNSKLAETIEEAALRCRDVVRALLRFGRQDPIEHQQDVDIQQVIEEALILAAGQMHTLSGHVICDIPNALPCVTGNRTQLIQVLLNLLHNAAQSAGPGAEVSMRAFVEQERLRIEVSDQGPGIPDNIRDRIFEPFFTTKDEGEGTGLGLSVAYGIIQQHGGMLSLVPSTQGATFRVCLPFDPSVNTVAQTPPEPLYG